VTRSAPPASNPSSPPAWDYAEKPLDELASSTLPSALPHGVRRVVAIGGGRPGAGHSVLTANLGVYLAQLGRRVVVVDADGTCPCLHAMLDVALPQAGPDPDFEADEALEVVPTPIQGLTLVPQRYTRDGTSPVRPGRKPRWGRKLRDLEADYILVDLGPGTSAASLDIFLTADFGICVTPPDPPAVEATYRYFRALFQRQLRRMHMKDRFKMRMVERALAELPPLPSPLEAILAIARYDVKIADLAASELAQLHPYLVTNSTRMRQDVELGHAMVDMAGRYLGVQAEDLGHIEQDDALWLSVGKRRPLLLDNPSSKAGRNLERIARRVVAVATLRGSSVRSPVAWQDASERSLYDVLWTHPGSSDEELRRAYKRQRDLFQSGSLPLISLLTEAELDRERGRLEEAQKTLLDGVRRRTYDLSFFPDPTGDARAQERGTSEADALEQAALRAELAPLLHAETEYTGPLLRRIRESQGIDLGDIAKKTKIAQAHLAAIEAEDFALLPAEVYTRGFVTQMAGLLGVDKTLATRSYMRRFRAFRKAQPEKRA
jgi:flagellar biosynthesis protein FlhG